MATRKPAKKAAARKAPTKKAPAKKASPSQAGGGKTDDGTFIQVSMLITIPITSKIKGYKDAFETVKDAQPKDWRSTPVTASIRYGSKTYSAWDWDFGKNKPNAGSEGRYIGAPNTGRVVKEPAKPDPSKPSWGTPVGQESFRKKDTISHKMARGAPIPDDKPQKKSLRRRSPEPVVDMPDVDFDELDKIAEQSSSSAVDAAMAATKKAVTKKKSLKRKAR